MTQQPSGGAAFSIGIFFEFISCKTRLTGRASKLIDYAVKLKMLGLHGEWLADIALSMPERNTPQGNLPEHDLAHLAPSLELRNVSFRYGEGEAWLLWNANFTVRAGESVAVAGLSGAGKTTLLKILLDC